ncbi:MAG: response regulator [Bacteroidales bacterium]
MEVTGKPIKRLLIIDDNEAIARVVMIYLKGEYESVWMENPLEAIEWIRNNQLPDLILSDIRMPQMRGDEFLLQMKSDENYQHIPIVMLSGEDSTTERERLLQGGAADYIVKPFNPLELKTRLKRIVG